MKILHLNTDDILGGAANAAYRLNYGLRQINVDSKMLVHRITSYNVCYTKLLRRSQALRSR